MIFAVLYKYLKCVPYEAIDAGHTAFTVIINYGIILLLLFITFWCKR